jgi:UDP-glucose 4-epimerase
VSGRALITGGRGYLGRSLSDALLRDGLEVTRIGRTPPDRPAPGDDVVGDVRERGAVEELVRAASVVFHLAAQTSVPVAEQDPAADLAANVTPLVHILDACARSGHRPVVVLASTATACGLPARLPVGDDAVDAPVTIYDLHKGIAERYLRYQAERGVVRGGSLRLANVYGPGPRSGAADRGVLNAMIAKALRGEPLTVYGDGRNIRDYVFVDDVVAAFTLAARHAPALGGRAHVIGAGVGHTIADAVALVAARVLARTGVRAPVVHVDPPRPPSPVESRDFVADSSGFSRATGWTARVKLADGIDRTIESCLAQGRDR